MNSLLLPYFFFFVHLILSFSDISRCFYALCPSLFPSAIPAYTLPPSFSGPVTSVYTSLFHHFSLQHLSTHPSSTTSSACIINSVTPPQYIHTNKTFALIDSLPYHPTEFFVPTNSIFHSHSSLPPALQPHQSIS